MLRAVPVGVGHALPGRVVPNSEFESFLDTTDSWIHERTGIRRRHFAADGELTSHLATDAARNALEDARLRVD
ncbi:MAG: 3-oxoacyl-ACP synthase, partial [Rhodobacteraceae bacterium]|nr:3-oxoacyl-ACP synthase [Paracoccaceae bacterium]